MRNSVCASIPALLAVLVFFAPFANSTCYARNGTAITSDTYQPCNQVNLEFSMCCNTNTDPTAKTSFAPDICLPNGLCENWVTFPHDNSTPTLHWRESCTDPTWQSPFCLKGICTSGSQAVSADIRWLPPVERRAPICARKIADLGCRMTINCSRNAPITPGAAETTPPAAARH